MLFLSCFKTLAQPFRHGASSQSKRNMNAIHSPVNDKRGADSTEGQRGEISSPPRANDTGTLLVAGLLDPNSGDSAYHPVSTLESEEAVGVDLRKFSDPTDNHTISAYRRRCSSRAATPS